MLWGGVRVLTLNYRGENVVYHTCVGAEAVNTNEA